MRNVRTAPPLPRPATSWPVPVAFLLILGGLFGSLGLPAPVGAQMHADPDASELQVSAEAEVEVAPDRAVVTFAVETEAETARATGEANAALMDRVLAAVQDTGLEGIRTETTGYQLVPRYSNTSSNQPREIVGYTARNHLRVTLDQVDAVGQVLDRALAAGANRVTGLQFQVRDPQPHREEALRRAVSVARSEAETVAAALEVTLGAPLEVQVGSSPTILLRGRTEAMAMAADGPTTPVEPGMQTVSANVTIRYRIHP